MTQEFTLKFVTVESEFRLQSTEYRFGDDIARCVSHASKENAPYIFRELHPREGSDAPGYFVFALAMVRVALWNFVKPVTQPEKLLLFQSDTDLGVAAKFTRLYYDAHRKDDPHHVCAWLQKMLWLSKERDAEAAKRRLESWFECKTSPLPRQVFAKTRDLPPSSVKIIVDEKIADERVLDDLERYLAFLTDAGFPFYFDSQGVRLMGRPPSVRPEFFGREEESHDLTKWHEEGEHPILCIEGPSTAGKTHLAMHWLRRAYGLDEFKGLVFFWSFAGQASQAGARAPTDALFTDLARAFEISEDVQSTAIVDAVLKALGEERLFLFLDGLEATIRERRKVRRSKHVETPRYEVDTAVRKLLRKLSTRKNTHVLLTSRVSVNSAYEFKALVMELNQAPRDPTDQIMGKYISDDELLRREEHEARRTFIHQDIVTSIKLFYTTRAGGKELRRAIKDTSPLTTPKAHFNAKRIEELPQFDKRLLDVLLRAMDPPARLLLQIIACCFDHSIEEQVLLTVAGNLFAPGGALHNALSPFQHDLSKALDDLIDLAILDQPVRSGSYSLQPSKARCIATAVQLRAPRQWYEIHMNIARYYEVHSKDAPATRLECKPLVNAALHFCYAGEREYAHERVCYERLSRRLQGHIMNYIGDYESPKRVVAALLGEDDSIAANPLKPMTEALWMHCSSMCSRYLDNLEIALFEEEDAWDRAKLIGADEILVPTGAGLLRLYHIFGNLRATKVIEWKLLFVMGWNSFNILLGKKVDVPEENLVDGAAYVCSILALSRVYRSAPGASVLLDAGVGSCRKYGAIFDVLLPTFGRPWHAWALLELGEWDRCLLALKSGEWKTEIYRYKQIGVFPLLEARLWIGLASRETGATRKRMLEVAAERAAETKSKALAGSPYRWWLAQSVITSAEVNFQKGRDAEAEQEIEQAEAMCRTSKFRLLSIDAGLIRAKILSAQGRVAESRELAEALLKAAREIGYTLRAKQIVKHVRSLAGGRRRFGRGA